MKKRAAKRMRGPTLQEIELVPITDPAKRAAIDRRRKEVKQEMAAAARKTGKRKSSKGK